ncbi:MAG: nucleoside deaminase [Pirellulales bacterium]
MISPYEFDESQPDDSYDPMHEELEFQSSIVDWDQKYMRQALTLAQQAMQQDEVPVGAIVTLNNKVVGSGWNQRESLQDPTAHAEMIAITQAAASIIMLAAARMHTLRDTRTLSDVRLGRSCKRELAEVVFGALDPKPEPVHSLYRLLEDSRLNHRCQVTAGIMAEDCG